MLFCNRVPTRFPCNEIERHNAVCCRNRTPRLEVHNLAREWQTEIEMPGFERRDRQEAAVHVDLKTLLHRDISACFADEPVEKARRQPGGLAYGNMFAATDDRRFSVDGLARKDDRSRLFVEEIRRRIFVGATL